MQENNSGQERMLLFSSGKVSLQALRRGERRIRLIQKKTAEPLDPAREPAGPEGQPGFAGLVPPSVRPDAR